MKNSRKLLESPKAIDTTTEIEKSNVMVEKSIDVTMDNQQPSFLKEEGSETRDGASFN